MANKADSTTSHHRVHEVEWRRLALGEPLPVSAANGTNVGELLDLLYELLKKQGKEPLELPDVDMIKVAIVGKPNVGKSSLFNKLIGQERVIVSPLAHTTREPHDTLVEVAGQYILFIDTAGIRRKVKVSGTLERLGIGKSIAAIERADMVLLVIDATEPITDQDQQLAGLLRNATKSVVIVVNKWDQAEDNTDAFRNEAKEVIYAKFPHLDYAPILLVSAARGYRVHQIFPLLERAWKERHTRLTPEEIKTFWQAVTRHHRPTRGKGVRHPKILGFEQIGTNPPRFELMIKAKTSVHMSYVHYIENRLRERFAFFAAPIIIHLTKVKR